MGCCQLKQTETKTSCWELYYVYGHLSQIIWLVPLFFFYMITLIHCSLKLSVLITVTHSWRITGPLPGLIKESQFQDTGVLLLITPHYIKGSLRGFHASSWGQIKVTPLITFFKKINKMDEKASENEWLSLSGSWIEEWIAKRKQHEKHHHVEENHWVLCTIQQLQT